MSLTRLLVPVRITSSFKLNYYIRIRPRSREIEISFLPKSLIINNQFVVGKKQEHIAERYSLLVLMSDDCLVVQAAEEFATSANILVVDPR